MRTIEKTKIEKVSEGIYQITLREYDLVRLNQLTENVSGNAGFDLNKVQTYIQFACSDRIKQRPDMADGYLFALNMVNTILLNLTQDYEFASDLYQITSKVTNTL